MESKKTQKGPDTAPYSKTGLRQRDEHSTLKEVVLGSTTAAAYPPKSRATANFTDHIPYLKGGFYDQFEDANLSQWRSMRLKLWKHTKSYIKI